MTDLERAKAFFKNDQFAIKTTGAEILAVGDHYAKCRLILDERHMNASGRVMGGVYYTLADFAFAVAANGHSTAISVTQQVSITFLSPSRGTRLIAEARCIKAGRATCLYAVDVTDDLGAQVAHLTVNGFTLPPKPKA